MSVRGQSSERRATALEARIRDVIAGLRPMLRIDPCGIELITFDIGTGVATVRIDGGCPDCEMPAATLRQGIEAHLRLRVPEIREVRTITTDVREHG
jgi:Fe-S cluster biogenesis protein NfuA